MRHSLWLWAYFSNQDLWYELLAYSTDDTPPRLRELIGDELDFEQHMRVLCNHGLAEADTRKESDVESIGYSVHACVHDWMRTVLNPGVDNSFAQIAVECLASHVPGQETQHWSLVQRRLLAHANRWTAAVLHELEIDFDLARSWLNLGMLYSGQGKRAEAEQMYMRALAGKEKALGADHTSTLLTVISLSRLRIDQHRIEEARTLYERVERQYDILSPPLRTHVARVAKSLATARNLSQKSAFQSSESTCGRASAHQSQGTSTVPTDSAAAPPARRRPHR